jgi:hypothetical protein
VVQRCSGTIQQGSNLLKGLTTMSEDGEEYDDNDDDGGSASSLVVMLKLCTSCYTPNNNLSGLYTIHSSIFFTVYVQSAAENRERFFTKILQR